MIIKYGSFISAQKGMLLMTTLHGTKYRVEICRSGTDDIAVFGVPLPRPIRLGGVGNWMTIQIESGII